jgi:hypothetical protein
MKIYFIRNETDYGPFFSTRDKAIQYIGDSYRHDPKERDAIIHGDSCYTGIQEVELDQRGVIFDG